MHKQIHDRNAKELNRLQCLIDNDLDRDGNTILDKFPHLVELTPPVLDDRYHGFIEWLDENVNKGEFLRAWVTKVYFKNEEDAVAFKLRWL